jgi:phospholipase C
MATDRRTFIQFLGAGAAAAAVPRSIARALSIPARRRTGTIKDVEHVVFLMQENRAFDHYFGTLRGVRGFGDPRVVKLPSGAPVWYQPHGSEVVLPFHPDAPDMGLQFLVDLPHGWTDTHAAWNKGKYDGWIAAKSPQTMAYLTRKDIPFHYALADAFTICDAYHCSLLGATDPNRYHMWTGWVGNDGTGGGPVVDNSEAGYDWHTYPERLTAAGISWKIYQDQGEGLDADHSWGWGPPYIGNYGDNSLLYFHQYQNAAPGSALYEGARTGTDVSQGGTLFDQFCADVLADKLPQVSWIVAPEAYSEHGNWPANYGAYFVSSMLDALTANPEVWSKTVFFYMFDENDGFFDHVVPPTPPASRAEGISTVDTAHEIFPGSGHYVSGPYGLGVRVPMIVISPWSKGGWVSSEVFDHTSLIRFLEQRFADEHPGLIETNITKWRRAVTGDLTSTLDFKTPNERIVSLPSTSGYAPTDRDTHPDYVPPVPVDQNVPAQEPGVRLARPVPYELHVRADVDSDGTVRLHLANTGRSTAVYQVRSGDGASGPWTYTVGPAKEVTDQWDLAAQGKLDYDLSVYGPNGFLRAYKGQVASGHSANLQVLAIYEPLTHDITLEIQNRSRARSTVQIWDAYAKRKTHFTLLPGQVTLKRWSLDRSYGWYDFTLEVAEDPSFQQRLGGHVETGRDSVSDPALGGL